MKQFDVIVLGGGPGGYQAAIRAAQLGLNTALVEARELGGTCLNRGCIPTKSLLHCAELYEAAKLGAAFGVTADGLSFDYAQMAARKDKVVARLRAGVESLQSAHGVTVVRGFGHLTDARSVEVGGETLSAPRVILATGSSPTRPPIPGIDGENVIDSDGFLKLTECPKSAVIIGGGVIGVEFASLLSALGVQVAVLEMAPTILPGIDAEIAMAITKILKGKGVLIETGAKVSSIQGGAPVMVQYELNGVSRTVEAAACIVCTGRTPNTGDIGLEQAGVARVRGYVQVNERMMTSVPGIYAVGDITGQAQLAHVASAQALVAAANCAGHTETMRCDAVPACLYTSPEAAQVGLGAQQAEQAGHEVKIGRFALTGNGRALSMGEDQGFCQLVTDARTGEILGAQILAPHASDLIAEICAVMRSEGTVDELADAIHPHPSISEIIMEAAQHARGQCVHAAPSRARR